MNPNQRASRPRGRPRSEAVRQRVLEASLELLTSEGLDALTIEGIAASAGVSKQTIYRWWQSRAAIALEALTEYAHWRIPTDEGNDIETELRRFLRATFRVVSRETGPVLAALMAEAQRDPRFATEFRQRLIDVRRDALRTLLTRARERGEISPDADLELLADIIYGAMWYRLLVGHAKLDDRLAESLARVVTTIG